MIRNTSQKEPEEKSISFSIDREDIEALSKSTGNYDISEIPNVFQESLTKLYP